REEGDLAVVDGAQLDHWIIRRGILAVPAGGLRDALEPRASQDEAAARYQGRSRGRDLRLPIRPHKSEPNVVQFRAVKIVASVVKTSRDEHLAVGQQRRRVNMAWGDEAASGCPGPGGRIVQFRARERAAAARTSCDQKRVVEGQRRRVEMAWGAEVAGGGTGPGGRMVVFVP